MPELKNIQISLPDNLLQQADEIGAVENKDRNEFICEAVRLYVKERHRRLLKEWMKCGYKEMAEINAELTEMGFSFDRQVLEAYESILSRRE